MSEVKYTVNARYQIFCALARPMPTTASPLQVGDTWLTPLKVRAALPSAEAKERAWRMIISDTGTSGRLIEATAGGFWQPEQAAVTEPYVPRYFAEMPAMMQIRSGMSAERVAAAAYPRYAVHPQTRRFAADLLATPDLDAILRRTVMDQDDDMRRALQARG